MEVKTNLITVVTAQSFRRGYDMSFRPMLYPRTDGDKPGIIFCDRKSKGCVSLAKGRGWEILQQTHFYMTTTVSSQCNVFL